MASSPFSKLPLSKSQSRSQSQSQTQPLLNPPASSQRSASAQRYQTQPIPQYNSFTRSASHPTSPGYSRQDEKNFITHYEERREIVPPEKIEHDAVNKKLGFASKRLRVSDFELMKTLGTGARLRNAMARPTKADLSSRHLCTSLARAPCESQTRRSKQGVRIEGLAQG
jgi:hypothetical protein